MQKVLRLLAAALAFSGAVGTASAQVMTFENTDNNPYASQYPFLGHADALVEGDYAVQMFSSQPDAALGDFVGAVMNLSSCFTLQCPTNNPTNYLGALNDGIPEFTRLDGGLFNLTQFDASFLGAGSVPISATAIGLQVLGLDAFNTVVQEIVWLPGPVNGNLSFSTYALSASFASTAFKAVDILGYACDSTGSCSRGVNLGQFGLDNVTFATPVPEPSTWALLCLGLIGIAVIRRRATAKA